MMVVRREEERQRKALAYPWRLRLKWTLLLSGSWFGCGFSMLPGRKTMVSNHDRTDAYSCR